MSKKGAPVSHVEEEDDDEMQVDEYDEEEDDEDDENEDEDDDDDDGPPASRWLKGDDDDDDDGLDDDDDDDDGDGGRKRSKETMVMNPTSVRERIDYALEILSDFKNRADKTQSRVDIVAALSRDLSEYYGYINELSDFLLDLFSPSECVEYMDASDRPRPMVIRANTLKVTRKDLMEALTKRGCILEAVEWSKVAIKVTESSVPIGATPEYLAGHYMLQSAASMNPVMALAPQPDERVLDMSAAPGGKTTYIAQLMKNSGTVIANDLKPQRQKATVANLHRMGVKNAIVCCYDGRKIPKIMRGFDRVLLDAPCSGLGVISRDQTVKLQRTTKDIQRIAHMQKELICAAIDAADPHSKAGGIIVYSTCSISCEENEQVVQYALNKRFVKIIDTGLEVGKPGLTRHKERRFHPSLALTRRFYPHVHNMDGFYVAKLQKYAHGVRGDEDKGEDDDDDDDDADGDDGEEEEEDEEPQTVKGAGKKDKKPAPEKGKKEAAAKPVAQPTKEATKKEAKKADPKVAEQPAKVKAQAQAQAAQQPAKADPPTSAQAKAKAKAGAEATKKTTKPDKVAAGSKAADSSKAGADRAASEQKGADKKPKRQLVVEQEDDDDDDDDDGDYEDDGDDDDGSDWSGSIQRRMSGTGSSSGGKGKKRRLSIRELRASLGSGKKR